METSAAHKWGIKIGRIKGQVSSFGNINKDTFSIKVPGGFKVDPNMPKSFSELTVFVMELGILVLGFVEDRVDKGNALCALCMTKSDIKNFNWSFDSWMRSNFN